MLFLQKIAREYQARPVHYHHTEHEVYDALPGSRRPSRTSISSRASRSSLARLFLRTDSSSSAGNRRVSHSEPPSRLSSHIEEPCEDDTLLDDVMYSPISARKTQKLEYGNHKLPSSKEMRPLFRSSGGSSTLSGDVRYPMLTIEVPRDSKSPRVVRWKAAGYDGFDEEADPFDLPKADDFDDAVASKHSSADNQTPSTKNVTHTSSSSEKSNAGTLSNPSVRYSNSPSISSSSSSSESQRGLNYATLASQNSESSEAGCVPVINVINPALFAPVDEEDDNQDNEDSGGIQYSQMAHVPAPNLSAAVPIPPGSEGGSIHPYSRIANSEVSGPESASTGSRGDNAEDYHQLARADPRVLPVVREERTGSNASQSYVQLANCNSPSPSLPRATTDRNAISGSPYSVMNADLRVPVVSTDEDSDSVTCAHNGPQSSHVEKRPENRDSESEKQTSICKPTQTPLEKQNNGANDAAESSNADSVLHVTPTEFDLGTNSSLSTLRSNVGASPNMQLVSPNPCPSPGQARTKKGDRKEPNHPYRSVRVPHIHTVAGSPLLPSRALDIRNSDSEDSSSVNYSHESLDSVGETRVTNGAENLQHDNQTYVSSQNCATEPNGLSDCQSELSSDDNEIPEVCVQESPGVSHSGVREERKSSFESSEEGPTKVEGTAPPSNNLMNGMNGGYVMRT